MFFWKILLPPRHIRGMRTKIIFLLALCLSASAYKVLAEGLFRAWSLEKEAMTVMQENNIGPFEVWPETKEERTSWPSGILPEDENIRGEEAEGTETVSVMFWNLENFFDWRADSLSMSDSDKEFSSFGSRHWTRKKFFMKCEAIAKSIFWAADSEGGLPDIIGVAEVENAFVLKKLKEETSLRKTDYKTVYYDSPDRRGIDVALMYRTSRLSLINGKPIRIVASQGSDTLVTRDILLSVFRLRGGDTLAVLINHHPSKYGGKSSEWKRQAALMRLRQAADSLQEEGIKNIVAAGDFNEGPEEEAFGILTGKGTPFYSGTYHHETPKRRLAEDNSYSPVDDGNNASEVAVGPYTGVTAGYRRAYPLVDINDGEGTIRYQGQWEKIDLFFISRPLAGMEYAAKVLRIPFLMERDNTYSGVKPKRTFIGPRYNGGVSDHCPILLKIKLIYELKNDDGVGG